MVLGLDAALLGGGFGPSLNNLEAGEALLSQAERRLENSRGQARHGSPAYAVRLAQECVELSLKAAMRFVGVDYPKMHDVNPTLLAVKDRFPKWFDAERVAKMAGWLSERRAPAMYGDEYQGIPPDKLFSKKDSKLALDYAEDVFALCNKLRAKLRR